MKIGFNTVSQPYGWMGNMYSCKIVDEEGKEWFHSEGLFQAMRYKDEEIKEEFRKISNPIILKRKAKSNVYKDKRVVEPTSEWDVQNMKYVLLLKFTQHPHLAEQLINTGSDYLYEDVTSRQKRGGSTFFWGACYIDGVFTGKNVLGELLMELREVLKTFNIYLS
jgi:predicted NAD-dependent protein-ADP-ribosyltransferase YbiA (DUF1768 family)